MFSKKTVRDIDVEDKIVLVRTDYNVPLVPVEAGELENEPIIINPTSESKQQIASDLRIHASLPTIKYLLEHKAAKIILMSHLGRPNGQRDKSLSLYVAAEKLAELLPGVTVNFVDDVSGPEVEMAIEDLPDGGILLLENLRFSPEEEANSEEFAREIVDSTHAELFVQDGFAVVHRAHTSTEAITHILPSVAGLLLEKEVKTLTEITKNPAHPFIVLIGGAKVADKQPLIDKFSSVADTIYVGGKIAADGYKSNNPKIIVAEDFDEDSTGVKLDIGPVSTTKLVELLQNAKTVLWNGVLGKVEDAAYATASTIVAKVIGENPNITSVICGGDTSGFVENLCADDPELKFSLVSTGGGAALELLSGQALPGVDGLEDL
jgi:3-phosphoglycerate kinase